MKRLRDGSVELVARGLLLDEDVPLAMERLLAEWDRRRAHEQARR